MGIATSHQRDSCGRSASTMAKFNPGTNTAIARDNRSRERK